ncbi:MAG: 5'-methylthioadenosine/S-adenosylhomocysteine nucleosidase [Nitrospinae bacterium]|nr:5'-methylthioadenosine/S-adenosylhomocysteine nucleosidase [Nitrospinota bacterium]
MNLVKRYTCIIGAVREEIVGIKRGMRIEQRIRSRGIKVFKGRFKEKDMLLVRSGVGEVRAEESVRLMVDEFPVGSIISLGYAGAVREGIGIGDIILCDRVIRDRGMWGLGVRRGLFSEEYLPNTDLFKKALDVLQKDNIDFHQGAILTVDRIISSPEMKRWIGETYPVIGVEMETAGLARVATMMGIPFLSIRAISDTVDDNVISFSSFLSKSGRILRAKAGIYMLRHPWSLRDFMELKIKSRRATLPLTRFIYRFMERRGGE